MKLLLDNQNESLEDAKKRHDKLLEKNSYEPVICVSCLSPITYDQAPETEETIHGFFHGGYMRCIEGRY